MGQATRLPGDEHVDSVDIEPIDWAGLAAHRERERRTTERAPLPPYPTKQMKDSKPKLQHELPNEMLSS